MDVASVQKPSKCGKCGGEKVWRTAKGRRYARCLRCHNEFQKRNTARARAAKEPRCRPTFVERFWANVEKRGADECWDWTGRTVEGYGVMKVQGVSTGAHRVAWLIATGDAPGEMHVCHRCDRRLCVNFAHLFLGSNLDNIADKVAKGRMRVGDETRLAKLTREQARWALEQHGAGKTMAAIARQLGVSKSCIWLIVHGKKWRQALSGKFSYEPRVFAK